jgi:hypothetical protein
MISMPSWAQEPWKPTKEDAEWLKGLIGSLHEGGTWILPASLSIYTFYHSAKEYGFMGDREHLANTRTFEILEELGWKERVV